MMINLLLNTLKIFYKMNANMIKTQVFDNPNLIANILINDTIGLKFIISYTSKAYLIL
jgi:hypothetical protein